MSKQRPKGEETQFSPRLKVQEEDFAAATRQNQFRCAIVRAVQRANPDAKNVRVNRRTIAWTIDEQRFTFPTPEIAIERVIRPLDTGTGELKPVTLRLSGGYVRPVSHHSEDELREMRQYMRHPDRTAPASKADHERFTDG